MKVSFFCREQYPFYEEIAPGDPYSSVTVELTEAELEDFRKTYKAMEAWNERLRDAEKQSEKDSVVK